MVEFLVAALFFLVPLFIAIAALGKFIDVQHTTDMAARYAAWERTVWYQNDGSDFNAINTSNLKSDAQLRSETAVRILNDRSSAVGVIRDNDKTASTFANGLDPLWRDGAAKAYLAEFSDVDTAMSSETPSFDIAAVPLAGVAAVEIEGLLSFAPPVPTNSMAVGQITLRKVAKDSVAYKNLWSDGAAWAGLDFNATGAILSNSWSANGSGGTHGMVARAVPTAQGLGAFVKLAEAGLLPWDPMQAGRIEVGKIAVDQVPGDRLK